jgi:glycosyltransferase involved in cell wall biosynthesis
MESTVIAVFGVDPFRIGGVEIYVRELALQLAARNTRLVAVFTRKPSGLVAEYLTAPNLILEEIPALETGMLASAGPLAQLLRRYRPRVLHLQFVNFVSVFAWVGKRYGVERIFFTAQGSEPAGFEARRSAWWKRMVVRLVNAPLTGVFCISEYVRHGLVTRDLLPRERFTVIYNAIEPPSLDDAAGQARQFRERFGIAPDRELVTQVSWIIPEKGLPQLLEAAAQVVQQRPTAHFAIVGSGAGEAEYRQKAAELGITGAITWTGLLSNPMQDGVYAATDIFCLASQWQEAFGWVIAEAMAFEKPVVATAVGGIPEVVQDGVTGLLVKPASDSQQLARQLLRLLEDAALRRQMGLAGRRAVEQKFQLRCNVEQVVSHYWG